MQTKTCWVKTSIWATSSKARWDKSHGRDSSQRALWPNTHTHTRTHRNTQTRTQTHTYAHTNKHTHGLCSLSSADQLHLEIDFAPPRCTHKHQVPTTSDDMWSNISTLGEIRATEGDVKGRVTDLLGQQRCLVSLLSVCENEWWTTARPRWN